MKYALIADIHANLQALQIVLNDIKSQKCGHIACLGDIVGYNQNPKECLDIIRGTEMPCVKGNLDEYCSTNEPPEGLNPSATEKVNWARAQLTEDDRKWLRELPHVMSLSGFTIVHSSLNQPQKWPYIFEKIAAAAHFECQTTPVCFYAHTHVPVAFVRGATVRGGTFSKFKVEAHLKYCVNVGSVGQPRDGVNKAAYVIYDLGQHSIELRRLPLPGSSSGGSGGDAPAPVTKTPAGGAPPSLSTATEIEGGTQANR